MRFVQAKIAEGQNTCQNMLTTYLTRSILTLTAHNTNDDPPMQEICHLRDQDSLGGLLLFRSLFMGTHGSINAASNA
jgi:hypothetical protein